MILIRADANERIGSGHIMRSLSIARAFQHLGERVVFVTADHGSDPLLSKNGFSAVYLDSDYRNMDSELSALIQLIETDKPDLLLIDSYFVNDLYFQALTPHIKTAYIDDLNAGRFDVDYLINYNIFSSLIDYSAYVSAGKTLLLSPLYAPLRDEFISQPQHKTRETVRDIFVSTGGADHQDVALRVIKEVCPKWESIRFHFVIGALNSRTAQYLAYQKDSIVFHINEGNMSELMQNCDLAISAAGSTLYELCACGTPTITYAMADNQRPAGECFMSQNIMEYAGDCRDNDQFTEQINKLIYVLSDDMSARKEKTKIMQNLVDGRGAERIAKVLLGVKDS